MSFLFTPAKLLPGGLSTEPVIIARLGFAAAIIEWRGPAPFLFAPIPGHLTAEIRFAAHEASYGWGVVPVAAQIGATRFSTSLFPRGDGYLLPIKVAVQRAEQLGLGDDVEAIIDIVARATQSR